MLGLGLGITAVSVLGPRGGISSFSPDAAAFEGDTYALRGGPLTGGADSTKASFSFWAQVIGPSDTAPQELLRSDTGRLRINRDASGRLSFTLSNGTTSFTIATQSTDWIDNDMTDLRHVAVSMNTNFAAGSKQGQILVNGVSDFQVISDTGPAFTADLTVNDIAFGATTVGGSFGGYYLKEFMFWSGVQIDWSVAANLAKVYANGNPVDPGDDGSLVTGTAPIMYHSIRDGDTASAWLTNRGTGGDFTVAAGALSRAKRALIGYGDSLMAGNNASPLPFKSWRFLVGRALSTPEPYTDYAHGVPGESIAQIETRFAAEVAALAAKYPDALWFLEGGYNSVASGATSIVNSAKQMRDDLLAVVPNANWYFVGIPNGGNVGGDNEVSGSTRYNTIVSANSQLATEFGDRFLDIRPWLIAHGLGDQGITPTSGDLTDIANDRVPRSLRDADVNGDGIHWVNAGHQAVANFIAARVQNNGVWSPDELSGNLLWHAEARKTSTLFQSNTKSGAVAADGDPIGYLSDLSPKAFDMTSSADDNGRPTFGGSAAFPYINIDNTVGVQYLRRAAAMGLNANIANGKGWWGVLVVRGNPQTSARYLLNEASSTSVNPVIGPTRCDGTVSSTIKPFYRNDAGTIFLNQVPVVANAYDNTDRVLVFVDTGSSLTIYVDSVAGKNGPQAYTYSTTTVDRTSLGGLWQPTVNNMWRGRVYGGFTAAGAPTDDDIAKALTWGGSLQGRSL